MVIIKATKRQFVPGKKCGKKDDKYIILLLFYLTNFLRNSIQWDEM